MNVLAIGYFDDFARFFLAVKKEFAKEDNNLNFKYLSLYLSGYLYFLARLHSVSFFSFSAWVRVIWNRKKYLSYLDTPSYKGINLDDIIGFYKKLGHTNDKNLKLQAIAYIDITEALLKRFKPDIILLSGDSRMAIEILDFQSKRMGIKTYYFEQGPFGTTILDSKGVNANASLRKAKFEVKEVFSKKQKIQNFLQRKRKSKYKRNPLYRGMDYIYQFLGGEFPSIIPPDIIEINNKKNSKINSKKYKKSTPILDRKKKIFLYILQVPSDVNMIYHSPFYKDHFSIVKDIYNKIPNGSQLIIREHPLYKKRYEKELYDFIHTNQLPLDKDGLYESIDRADVVIVNNSTVGIEAISRLKPVIVLGDSYYDAHDDLCLKLENKEKLSELLKKSLSYSIDEKKLICFLDSFLFRYLIDGHFRDEKLTSPKKIVSKVLNDL